MAAFSIFSLVWVRRQGKAEHQHLGGVWEGSPVAFLFIGICWCILGTAGTGTDWSAEQTMEWHSSWLEQEPGGLLLDEYISYVMKARVDGIAALGGSSACLLGLEKNVFFELEHSYLDWQRREVSRRGKTWWVETSSHKYAKKQLGEIVTSVLSTKNHRDSQSFIKIEQCQLSVSRLDSTKHRREIFKIYFIYKICNKHIAYVYILYYHTLYNKTYMSIWICI